MTVLVVGFVPTQVVAAEADKRLEKAEVGVEVETGDNLENWL